MTRYHYFASGSSRVGDVLGFHRAGVDVGVTAPEVSGRAAEETLCSLAGTGRRVFVDSGAFSEIDFGPDGPFVVEPITDAEWNERLDCYERLARVLGSQLYVVAPDKVAFQWETLERLEQYAPRVRALRALGANIIVAHQKGSLSLAEFNAYAVDFLGFDDFICGIPSAKDATNLETLREFCAAVKPARLHLLGLGPKGKSFGAKLAAIAEVSPETEVFCDSVALTPLVGRPGKNIKETRVLTAAQDAVAVEVAEVQWCEGFDGCDYTDNILETANEWLTGSSLTAFLDECSSFIDVPRSARSDVRAWVWEADNDWVLASLDKAWVRYTTKRSATHRKAEGVRRVFAGPHGDGLRSEG